MLNACLTCGTPTHTKRCPNCTPRNATSWNNGRDRVAQARFRKAVLQRDNHACTICGTTQDLQAAHIIPLAQGGTYDVSNGQTLCRAHHRTTDSSAR